MWSPPTKTLYWAQRGRDARSGSVTKRVRRQGLGIKPLLSVGEAAALLDLDRSTAYRAIRRNTFPVPVHTIAGRLRIPRRAVERLLDGGVPEDPAISRQRMHAESVEPCPSC